MVNDFLCLKLIWFDFPSFATWTRSNNRWTVPVLSVAEATEKEMLEKAYSIAEEIGDRMKHLVDYVHTVIDDNIFSDEESKEI